MVMQLHTMSTDDNTVYSVNSNLQSYTDELAGLLESDSDT